MSISKTPNKKVKEFTEQKGKRIPIKHCLQNLKLRQIVIKENVKNENTGFF